MKDEEEQATTGEIGTAQTAKEAGEKKIFGGQLIAATR
jgi:hypothetical protein